MKPPLIGLTADIENDRFVSNRGYARAVAAAGGVPVIIPPIADFASEYVQRCDGIILTGGDDPSMEPFGVATHPKARPMHLDRQQAEIALLDALRARDDVPVLGVCLGMQLMALHAGGMLDQHLPDTLPSAERHAGNRVHSISGVLGEGEVTSSHRQAVSSPGSLTVLARADDGVIEAIGDRSRAYYLGVQWHPERTADARFGVDLIRELVAKAAAVRGL